MHDNCMTNSHCSTALMNHENESQKENIFLPQVHSIVLPFTTSQMSSMKGLQTVNNKTN